MEKNLKQFAVKSAKLIGLLFLVTFAFRFPIDYFSLGVFSMNQATTIFSKSEAIKITALALIFFGLYYKDKISKINHPKEKGIITASYIFLGIVSVCAYYLLKFYSNTSGILMTVELRILQIISILFLLLTFIFFTCGIFTADYLKKIYLTLKIPIWITAGTGILAYYALMSFQSMWPYFAQSISITLYNWYSPIFPAYLEMGAAPLLDVNGFSVSIGAPCSGIESMCLFIMFSAGIYAIDRQRINTKIFALSFIFGLGVIYYLNIIRLFLLILAGIFIGPHFAVGIFHTNAGWIIFAGYFLLHYYIMKHFLYKKQMTTLGEQHGTSKQ